MKWVTAILILMLFGLQYRLWIGDGSLSEVVQLEAELKKLQNHIQQLETRNRKLESQVIELQQGLTAYEKLARENLGMIKKDETFYQIVQPSQKPSK